MIYKLYDIKKRMGLVLNSDKDLIGFISSTGIDLESIIIIRGFEYEGIQYFEGDLVKNRYYNKQKGFIKYGLCSIEDYGYKEVVYGWYFEENEKRYGMFNDCGIVYVDVIKRTEERL